MRTRTTLAAFALLAFAMAACNGEPDYEPPPGEPGAEPEAMAPGQEMDPEAMALLMEAREIQERIAPVEQQAMQDPELAQKLQDVQQQVEDAMREEDPEVFEEMERLEAAFMAAQEEGDEDRAQEVGMEAQAAYARIQSLQQAVLDRPEIREPIEDFEQAHRERMIEIDPEVEDDLDRLQEITRELEGQQGGSPDG